MTNVSLDYGIAVEGAIASQPEKVSGPGEPLSASGADARQLIKPNIRPF